MFAENYAKQRTNPDKLANMMLEARGEFSIQTEMAFHKFLVRLTRQFEFKDNNERLGFRV